MEAEGRAGTSQVIPEQGLSPSPSVSFPAKAACLSCWLGGHPSQERNLSLGHSVGVLHVICGEWPRWPGAGRAAEGGPKTLGTWFLPSPSLLAV